MHHLLRLLLVHLLTCATQNALGSEIIHGKKVPDEMMLYMASVQSSEVHVCGGFLVNEDFVVTAAHCNKEGPISVVLGTHNLKKLKDGMRYNVTMRCQHPSYNGVKNGNDIMLLKLSQKAQLNNKVKPVQLPKNENEIKDKTKCRVAGWGRTKSGGNTTNVLQMVSVHVLNLKVCKKLWKNINDLPNNVVCAGGYDTDKGFCQGDSGGPLVCGGAAFGVVSFNLNSNCDYPNAPNVYTDVSKYLPWIKNILKKKNC